MSSDMLVGETGDECNKFHILRDIFKNVSEKLTINVSNISLLSYISYN